MRARHSVSPLAWNSLSYFIFKPRFHQGPRGRRRTALPTASRATRCFARCQYARLSSGLTQRSRRSLQGRHCHTRMGFHSVFSRQAIPRSTALKTLASGVANGGTSSGADGGKAEVISWARHRLSTLVAALRKTQRRRASRPARSGSCPAGIVSISKTPTTRKPC